MTETLTGAEPRTETEGLHGAAPQVEAVPPSVSIVVPYYNPGDRLRATVERLVCALDGTGLSYEIITVSDGSTDHSPHTLAGFAEPFVRRVSYADNIGKGHALRTGLAMSQGRHVGFIDADGDLSPDLFRSFLAVMISQEADIVVGSKRHRDSSVRWTPLRRFYSSAHQLLVRGLFGLDVKDTQVGIKLMDRRVVADVLPLLRESRFALDLELLVLARHLGYTRILEQPVRIEDRLDSTISVRRAWRLLVDTFGVFTRFSIRRQYDAAIRSRSVGSVTATRGSLTVTGTPATVSSALPA